MNRIEVINSILDKHPSAIVFLSNGLTSREAAFYNRQNRCFYMLHAMGETLSVAVGFAQCRPDMEVVVIDGDGNALMGLSSWNMMPIPNITYYVIANGISETTGGQQLSSFPMIPTWCNLLEFEKGKMDTPNPPQPNEIYDSIVTWIQEQSKNN
jgi:thiamine pyrophosphate-dependent acetolactate synthase large subunit-like protein